MAVAVEGGGSVAAARNTHKGWFIALFLINTMAILEITYLFGFSKRKSSPAPVI